MAVCIIGDAFEEIMLVNQFLRHALQRRDDRRKCLVLLRHHVFQRDVLISLDDPRVRRVIVQQGGTEIGIPELIQEGIQRALDVLQGV